MYIKDETICFKEYYLLNTVTAAKISLESVCRRYNKITQNLEREHQQLISKSDSTSYFSQ